MKFIFRYNGHVTYNLPFANPENFIQFFLKSMSKAS